MRNQEEFFLAGAARTDITPPTGTLINGDFLPRRSARVNDALFVRALYMRDASTEIVIVIVDTCVMSIAYTNTIKAAVEKQTGISFQQICISTTHTHSAGSVSEVHLCPADAAYSETVANAIVDTVINAKHKAVKAKIAFGSVAVPEHVLCRRYVMKSDQYGLNPVTGQREMVVTNPLGVENEIESAAAVPDPELAYLAIQDHYGKWISILANYSLHYVGDWEDGIISADYFGEFERQVQRRFSNAEQIIAMMSNGTSGDVNCRDFLHPHRYPKAPSQKTEAITLTIVERMMHSIERLSWTDVPGISVQYEELPLNYQKPFGEEIRRAKELVADVDFSKIDASKGALPLIYAREQILLDQFPTQLAYPIQAFQIGDGIIGCMSGEIFSETGLAIKKEFPKKYFTISLANGNAGYIPPAHEIERGGYETWRCRYSGLQPEAESIIRQKFLEFLHRF